MYTVMYICIYARRFVGRCGVHANKYGGVCVCVHENLYRRVCVCLSIVCLQYCMHKRTCMYAVLYTRMHKMSYFCVYVYSAVYMHVCLSVGMFVCCMHAVLCVRVHGYVSSAVCVHLYMDMCT